MLKEYFFVVREIEKELLFKVTPYYFIDKILIRNGTLINYVFIGSYFLLIQGKKHERSGA